MTSLGALWEREILSRLLDHGMRGVDPIRGEVLTHARGRTLELGFGTGASLPHYPRGAITELVAVEPARELGAIGRERLMRFGRERGVPTSLIEGSASRPLPLDAGSFDTVVVLFVLCSIQHLMPALEQAHRLLRPTGTLVLAEHVAADRDPAPHPIRDRAQRVIRPAWKLALGGCDPHKALDGALERAGFDTTALERRELDLPWIVRSGLIGRAPRR